MASSTELIKAAKNGNKSEVFRCLQRGDDINATDQKGLTALNWALVKLRKDVAINLLERGADPNRGTNSQGETPLLQASKYHNYENVVSMLIDKGADVNKCSLNGRTALMCQSSLDFRDNVLKLIEKGAQINARDCEKRTALHYAAMNSFLKATRILLDNGADVNAYDKKGETALDYAKTYSYDKEIENLLESVEKDGGTSRGRIGGQVDVMREERRRYEALITNLEARMEGKIKTQIELRETQWREEKRVMDERIGQLENDKAIKDERIKELEENLKRFEEDKNQMKTELDKMLKNNLEKESQLDKSANVDEADVSLRSYYSKLGQVYTQMAHVADPIIPKKVQSDRTNVKNKLFQLEAKVNEVERVKYSDTVEIVGVEEKPREDLELILVSLARVLGLSIPKDVIEVSRFPSVQSEATNRPRVILVKFQKTETATSWLAAFKEQRSRGLLASSLDSRLKDDRIFINQKLTSFDKKLLRRVKQFAKDNEYKFVWVQEGKILLRENTDSAVIRIKTASDIPSK